MIHSVACGFLVLCTTIAAAEQGPAKANEPAARVECLGKLRHGLVAIGGETTGTTITFDGVTWELKLPNDEIRLHAEKLNKKAVEVVGTLRQVRGVEVPVRWIVDVEKLAVSKVEIKGDAKSGWAKVAITGILQRKNDPGSASVELRMASGGADWRLDCGGNPELHMKSNSLDGQLVTTKGLFVRAGTAKTEDAMNLKIDSIEVAAKR